MGAPKDRANDPSRQAKPRELLSPGEAATRFSVHPKTLANWHKAGKVEAFPLPGKHRRYYADSIEKLIPPSGGQ